MYFLEPPVCEHRGAGQEPSTRSYIILHYSVVCYSQYIIAWHVRIL